MEVEVEVDMEVEVDLAREVDPEVKMDLEVEMQVERERVSFMVAIATWHNCSCFQPSRATSMR